MLADDRQIKVLGLNEIVGQMTRHRWLFRLWQFHLPSAREILPNPQPTNTTIYLHRGSLKKPLNQFTLLSVSFSVSKLRYSLNVCKQICSFLWMRSRFFFLFIKPHLKFLINLQLKGHSVPRQGNNLKLSHSVCSF